MIQLTVLPSLGAIDMPGPAGVSPTMTSDFALALAQIAVPAAMPAESAGMPVDVPIAVPASARERQGLAAAGTILPDAGDARPTAELVAAPLRHGAAIAGVAAATPPLIALVTKSDDASDIATTGIAPVLAHGGRPSFEHGHVRPDVAVAAPDGASVVPLAEIAPSVVPDGQEHSNMREAAASARASRRGTKVAEPPSVVDPVATLPPAAVAAAPAPLAPPQPAPAVDRRDEPPVAREVRAAVVAVPATAARSAPTSVPSRAAEPIVIAPVPSPAIDAGRPHGPTERVDAGRPERMPALPTAPPEAAAVPAVPATEDEPRAKEPKPRTADEAAPDPAAAPPAAPVAAEGAGVAPGVEVPSIPDPQHRAERATPAIPAQPSRPSVDGDRAAIPAQPAVPASPAATMVAHVDAVVPPRVANARAVPPDVAAEPPVKTRASPEAFGGAAGAPAPATARDVATPPQSPVAQADAEPPRAAAAPVRHVAHATHAPARHAPATQAFPTTPIRGVAPAPSGPVAKPSSAPNAASARTAAVRTDDPMPVPPARSEAVRMGAPATPATPATPAAFAAPATSAAPATPAAPAAPSAPSAGPATPLPPGTPAVAAISVPPSVAAPVPAPRDVPVSSVAASHLAGRVAIEIAVPAPRLAAPVPPQPAAQAFAAQAFAAASFVVPPSADDRDDLPAEVPGALPLAALAAPSGAPLAVHAPVEARGPAIDLRRDEWMGAMIERIETLTGEGGARETRIRLAPDALGTVDVAIHHDEAGGVQIRIAAESPQARAILADAAPRLADMAEARGLRLGGAQVDAGAAHTGHGGREAPRHDPATPVRPVPAAANDDAADPTDSRIA